MPKTINEKLEMYLQLESVRRAIALSRPKAVSMFGADWQLEYDEPAEGTRPVASMRGFVHPDVIRILDLHPKIEVVEDGLNSSIVFAL